MTNIHITRYAKATYYFSDPDLPISVKRVEAGPSAQHPYDLTIEPHLHDFAELVIITRGHGRHVVDDVEYGVGTGDVFLIQGESGHYFKERNSVSLINVMYDPVRLPLPFDWLRRLPGYNVIFEIEPARRSGQGFRHHLKLDTAALDTVVELCRRLENELEAGSALKSLLKLQELIIFVAETCGGEPGRSSGGAVRIGTVISRLETDYRRNWSLHELSQLAGTSVNNLLRLFRSVTGATPIEYLNRIRLRHAAALLKHGSNPISEVAQECGFADSNYFTRKFRTQYGTTPREYRNQSGH